MKIFLSEENNKKEGKKVYQKKKKSFTLFTSKFNEYEYKYFVNIVYTHMSQMCVCW